MAALQIPGRCHERGLLHPKANYNTEASWLMMIDDPMDSESFVHVPPGPGMGWDIDWDFIAANEIK